MAEISSLANERVKGLLHLRERRDRDRQKRFLVEGYRELLAAAESGHPVDELYYCPEFFLGSNEWALIERLGASTIRCTERVFRKASYRDRPDGLLGVSRQFSKTLCDLAGSLFVVCEAIEKPGNLGTILRACDATGVDGVLVCDRCTDIYNPNVVRASVGTLFTVPIVETSTEEALTWLKRTETQLVAAVPDAPALYTQVDLKGRTAMAFGTEQLGLSRRWIEAASVAVQIPMRGSANSLNVAVSAGVLLYEALRQRF